MDKEIKKIVLIVEYDGTNYFGFQLQARHDNQPTIQSELEKAIFKLTGERLRILAASRTDAGVHAKGQVVSFRTKSNIELKNFVSGLNHYLPEDIAVLSAYKVNDKFNVRSDAQSREYSYYILNRSVRSAIWGRYAYLVTVKLDVDAMDKAAGLLIGKHDFASFTGNPGNLKTTVREVMRSKVEIKGDLLVFSMTANSFLPHQIRNTMGALIQVGMKKMTVDKFYEIIEARKPGLAGPRVPANGLFLMRVNYSRSFGEMS